MYCMLDYKVRSKKDYLKVRKDCERKECGRKKYGIKECEY